jgi:hypothetical protein
MDGALYGTAKMILPTLAPLFVTPVSYIFAVPATCAVFIKNGCPGAFISKTYVNPRSKVRLVLFNPSIS